MCAALEIKNEMMPTENISSPQPLKKSKSEGQPNKLQLAAQGFLQSTFTLKTFMEKYLLAI